MRLPFELFLALRLLRPRRSYVSVITILSLLGVLFGVGALIVVISVMDGFQKELREKIIGFQPHIRIWNSSVMYPDENLDQVLKSDPDVVGVTPFVTGPVLARTPNGIITAPDILGVDDESIESVLPLKNTIVDGAWELGPDQIIVGVDWARQMGAQVGDKVQIFSPRNLEQFEAVRSKGGKVDQSLFLPNEYIISGIFSSGYYAYDQKFFLISLPEAQKLYTLGLGYHGLSLRTKDPMKVKAVKERLEDKLLPPVRPVSWMDQNRQLVGSVAVERVVMFVLLSLIIVVAAIGVMSTTITVTVQKTREIGLLKALGAKNVQVIMVFTLYGFVVGLIGTVLGVVFGLGLVEWRNEFREFLGQQLGMEIFPAEIYNLPLIPAAVDYGTVALTAFFGIAFSTVAAFLPALTAAQADPAESLHSD